MDKDENEIVFDELNKPCFPGEFAPGNTKISPLSGGLTNRSYSICRGNDKFVFRLVGENSGDLGIDRSREKEAAERTSRAGINVPLEGFDLPRGHMLTRWVEGKEWPREEYGQENVIVRCATLLARVHKLEPLEGSFDPYRDISERVHVCRERNLALPENLDSHLAYLEQVREKRRKGPLNKPVFCHNDPFFNNFYDAGDRTLLLDWEFAGTGDVLFDLASATQMLDSPGRMQFYEHYARSAEGDCPGVSELAEATDTCRFAVMFWNGLWALIQSSHGHMDHDFSQMAANIFGGMDRYL